MTDISICSSAQEGQKAEIDVCSSAQQEQNPEINLCPGEPPDCTAPPEVFLSGTDEPVVGSVYSASGGTAPYTYSFDSGSISSTGEILSINACGGPGTTRAGVITVTDACSQTAQIEGRLPGGAWGDWYYEFYHLSNTDGSITVITGAIRRVYYYWTRNGCQKQYSCPDWPSCLSSTGWTTPEYLFCEHPETGASIPLIGYAELCGYCDGPTPAWYYNIKVNEKTQIRRNDWICP